LTPSERRHSERFKFDLPLIVRWIEGAEQFEARTVTHDVSSGGMYFYLQKGIPEGTEVEIEIALPAQITLGAPTKVRCRGSIRRCDQKAGETAGMATAIEKYEFLAKNEDAA
jgi:c-di-GMP-binding flagellar brake protein YcgR